MIMRTSYKRPLKNIFLAAFQKRNFVGLYNILTHFEHPIGALFRYFFHCGNYPMKINIRNKKSWLSFDLETPDTELTLIEIFCQKDYPANESDRVIVDIGSNVGISAIWFLTCSTNSYLYLVEPDPKNINKLKNNLVKYKDRYKLKEIAVSDFSGSAEFSVEPTGRYGGLGQERKEKIKVEVVHINSLLEEIIEKHHQIDILKIDTEGQERKILKAIDNRYLNKIRKIYLDEFMTKSEMPKNFNYKQYGCVCQLTHESIK